MLRKLHEKNELEEFLTPYVGWHHILSENGHLYCIDPRTLRLSSVVKLSPTIRNILSHDYFSL